MKTVLVNLPSECFGGLITISGVVLASIFGPKGDEPDLKQLPPVFGEAVVIGFLLPQIAFAAAWIAVMKRPELKAYRPPEISPVKAFLSACESRIRPRHRSRRRLRRRPHHCLPAPALPSCACCAAASRLSAPLS